MYDGYDSYDGGWLVADDRGRDSGCDDYGGISHAWQRQKGEVSVGELLVVEHCATGCDDMMWLHRLHAVHGGLHAVHGGLHAVHGGLHRLHAVHGGGCLLPGVNEPVRVRM